MCIAVPAQVINYGEMVATVDFGGIRQDVNITLIDNLKIGDYLLVHCGCAIEKLNREAAEQTLSLLEKTVGKLNGGED